MEKVWAQYGRKNRIPTHIKEELRLAGFKIRSRRTWLNRTQISEGCEHITIKERLNMVLGNRKDILELDELPDDCLKANFGYTVAGIENLREQADEVRKEEAIWNGVQNDQVEEVA